MHKTLLIRSCSKWNYTHTSQASGESRKPCQDPIGQRSKQLRLWWEGKLNLVSLKLRNEWHKRTERLHRTFCIMYTMSAGSNCSQNKRSPLFLFVSRPWCDTDIGDWSKRLQCMHTSHIWECKWLDCNRYPLISVMPKCDKSCGNQLICVGDWWNQNPVQFKVKLRGSRSYIQGQCSFNSKNSFSRVTYLDVIRWLIG